MASDRPGLRRRLDPKDLQALEALRDALVRAGREDPRLLEEPEVGVPRFVEIDLP